jgi:hypothetical protein
VNGDHERKVPWTPPPAPVPKQQTPAPRRTTGPVEQEPAQTPAPGTEQAEATPGVSVLPRLPAHTIDPGLGRLSLGISTFDDFDVDAGGLKPAHAKAMADVVDKLGMLLSKFPVTSA